MAQRRRASTTIARELTARPVLCTPVCVSLCLRLFVCTKLQPRARVGGWVGYISG